MYQIIPFSTFVGNFAALVLSGYSALSFVILYFKKMRISSLLIKDLYRYTDEDTAPDQFQNLALSPLSQSLNTSSHDH